MKNDSCREIFLRVFSILLYSCLNMRGIVYKTHKNKCERPITMRCIFQEFLHIVSYLLLNPKSPALIHSCFIMLHMSSASGPSFSSCLIKYLYGIHPYPLCPQSGPQEFLNKKHPSSLLSSYPTNVMACPPITDSSFLGYKIIHHLLKLAHRIHTR